jgi:hypothetical protein
MHTDSTVGEFRDPLNKTYQISVCPANKTVQALPESRDWIDRARSVEWDASIEKYVDPCDDECRAVEILLAAQPGKNDGRSLAFTELEIEAGILGLRRNVTFVVFHRHTRQRLYIAALIDATEGTVAA